MNINLKQWGFNEKFASEAALYEGLYAGRVVSRSRDLYRVICRGGEVTAEVSGRFRFDVKTAVGFPAVGDFVMLDRESDADGNALIHRLLSRKSAFIRKAAGTVCEGQVVAGNIDTVFICMSMNRDFNPRRLERYLAVGWDSGAIPVVVLTKADLCGDVEQKFREATAVAPGADVLVLSAVSGDSCSQLRRYVEEGKTAAFTGSSGVGKSTLINMLLGENRLDTQGLRNDDKGRHTTTRRELILIPDGGMVVDTPGMRELGLEGADFSKSFSDIEELAAACKFYDCTHVSEPGCAVQKAVREGFLSAERLSGYRKLQKEVKYEGLDSRQIENEKIRQMFGGMKNARRFLKAGRGKTESRSKNNF